MTREAKIGIGLIVFLGVLFALIWFVTLPAIRSASWTDQPSSEEVVQAFRDGGLEAGESYPVEQEPGWEELPVPKTYQEATRFEIPSIGEDAGGRVFIFDSRRDLSDVHDYYENLPEGLRPHLYVEDGVLLQLNNQLPVSEARKYRDVLRDTA
ncbi:MAG TPA: hypothetical protein VFE09_03155 [Rubrobacteraceae bacterium]|nr:hypothetical protein [Rubrobacteraceae bacterium]